MYFFFCLIYFFIVLLQSESWRGSSKKKTKNNLCYNITPVQFECFFFFFLLLSQQEHMSKYKCPAWSQFEWFCVFLSLWRLGQIRFLHVKNSFLSFEKKKQTTFNSSENYKNQIESRCKPHCVYFMYNIILYVYIYVQYCTSTFHLLTVVSLSVLFVVKSLDLNSSLFQLMCLNLRKRRELFLFVFFFFI